MARSSIRYSLVVLALLGAVVGQATAAVDWPVQRGPSQEPVPFKYDPAQWKKVPAEYLDDAPACTLYSGTTYLVAADGTIDTITHEVTRFNSRKAIEKLGEYHNISYDPAYEKVTLNEARVIKADGQSLPVEPRHVQLRDVGTDYLVYDSSKQLVISFPSLEVGDCIEVKWTTHGKNPEHQGQFFTRYSFGDDRFPVVTDEIRVRLPKDKPLKYAPIGGKIEPKIAEEGDNRLYHWQATNCQKLPSDDNLPSKEDLRLQVAMSTFASWDDVLKWKQKLRSDCWKCTEEVRKKVAEITKDQKETVDKARALTYWVRRNVRYVSQGEKHDYTPHSPGHVLETRFGDCKDQSQLLAVMLKEAGVPVALATLGVLDDGQVLESVPSPWGTHAILLVTIDGVDHWIDTTVSLAGWDLLRRDDRDRLCYVVDDKGLRLVKTPPLSPEENSVNQTSNVRIAADGSSHSERTTDSIGVAGLSRRFDWVEVPSGERRRGVAGELQDANGRTRLVEFKIDEAALADFGGPVKSKFVFDVPGHFALDPDREGIREGSITDSYIWGRLLAYNLDYERTVPFDLGAPFESTHRYSIMLPPFYRLDSKLEDRTIESKWGSFKLTIHVDDDDPRHIELKYHTRLEKPRIDPADFDEFRKFHEEIGKAYRTWISLKPVHELADAPLLEAQLRLQPGDNVAAAMLADIYLHNDKPKEARRVLKAARPYHPEDIALAELAVKSAEGLKDEEIVYRDLAKQFPDELRFAVALGRNLVAQSKYPAARKILEPVVEKGAPTQKALAHLQLARSDFAQNKVNDAFNHLEDAAEADAETAATFEGLALRARVLEKLNQLKEAAEAYKKALDLNPDADEALEALVRINLATKKSAEALDSLRRYTIAVGSDVAGLAKAADYNFRLGRIEEATELATRARDGGGHVLATRTLGLVSARRGDYAKAVSLLERCDPDAVVIETLIRGNLAIGAVTEAARQASEEAPKIDVQTPELKLACQQVANVLQRRKALAALVKEGPAEGRDKAVDALVCAELALADGRSYEQVEVLLAAAVGDTVPVGPAFALRGILQLEKGRLIRALADAERSGKLSPEEARGYYVRGRVRLERADKDATADLTKAAELSQRKDATILHWLATALHQNGQKAEALAAQREAVKLKPEDKELTEQLHAFEKGGKPGDAGQ